MRPPESLASLFRNYRFRDLDLERDRELIVRTVLARGTWEQIRWLWTRYGPEVIKDVFLKDYYGLRTMPAPTRRLWELLFVTEPLPEEVGAQKWMCRRIPARKPDSPGDENRRS